ncbi:LPP20 family lipoprotein [Marinomonas algarum]|uniref:LPP20 family lipoprotein n=1 Tax=Marinomonas algarum TaxID=2883105 RepID=A0A9X1IMM0_9GAMM|nr:LPP20 family lipoprotein [Marinomonas algarum]MCB5161106.1 LPP20 family lipoprotein [Marinomonas algarum]
MIHSAHTKTLYWAATAALALTLSGCLSLGAPSKQTPETLPNWVLSPPTSNTHLYGVGSASRIDNVALAFTQAEQNGNAQIAQQLRTQVSQVNTQNTQVQSGQGGEQVSKSATAYTRVSTSPIELEQATNEARFAAEHYVYALQSIDRSRIVTKLTQAIEETDARIRNTADRLATQQHQMPVEQDWRTYMQLIPYFAQRQSYQNDLNLYSTERTLAGKADAEIQAIEQQLNQALSFYGFDTSNTTQAESLASALSQFGLTPNQQGTFHLKSNTSQRSDTQADRFYVFEEGTLTLLGPDNTHLASWTIRARGIGKSQESAAKMATDNWSTQAIEDMFDWLTKGA